MQYHIQTTPIWDSFKSECECPLCKLYKLYNARIVSQYLNEAVMEPSSRIKVNKLGFCTKHSLELFGGENKLGLSLQMQTRTDAIIDKLKPVKNVKQALSQAEVVEKLNQTCVICDSIDEIMTRFAYTIAQMYLAESEFPELFFKAKGFCVPHYALLLKNSSRAGKKLDEYLNALYTVMVRGLNETNAFSKRFSDMFDFNSSGKFEGAQKAVPNAINKIKGEII